MPEKKYVLFGSGYFGKLLLYYLDKKNVEYFIDNNPEKWGTKIEGISVLPLNDILDRLDQYQIVVSVGEENEESIVK